MIAINKQEIKYINHAADTSGRVFYWKNRLFRGIATNGAKDVKEMFSSGLIQKLIKDNLIPPTAISNYSLDGYDFVIEHKKIERVTYPHEWSFSMLKDALITILKINIIALKYGFQTKDGHVYNIVFDKSTPVFVDLGSLVKTDYSYWACYKNFMMYFDILKKWSRGNFYYASRLISDDYPTRYFYPTKRISIANLQNIYLKFFSNRKTVNLFVLQLGKIFSRVFPLNKYVFTTNNLGLLLAEVNKVSYNRSNSVWGGYHNEFYNKSDVVSNKRFDEIIKITQEFKGIKSATDLASNQGVFSRILSQRAGIKDVVCMDNDEIAIEMLYRRIKDKLPEKKVITPVLQNMIWPLAVNYVDPPAHDRFKSDVVYALAITHHLILAQNFSLEDILEEIKQYSNKYVFVEFMPLGLFDGVHPVEVPSWYNIKWFREKFVEKFDLLKERQLEPNRVVFVGQLSKSKI
jgi:hypothetical protein